MDVAIIGLASKFPGADNYADFWDNLMKLQSSIVEIPEARWDWRSYWGDPSKEKNKSLSKWSGLIKDVAAFDASFFGVLPKVAQTMDPQQRIMLELVWSCLEDAGIRPSSIRGKKVGVIFGVFNHDYKEIQESGDVSIEAHHSTGTAATVIANRVSHFFDFKGPSLPIDTACSSSLNALHSAIQAMQFGDCEMALAGGVNLLLTPTRHISFSKMGMLSPTGSCKTFDDSADGYVRGEGAGVVLLKPLKKALDDGDTIHGVIKGSAINHCGETYTLTYPSPEAQAEVIVNAHRRAEVPVSTVTYIETHGTGTPKGDPIEFDGLVSAFATLAGDRREELGANSCGLGSVKTNIGHLEAAAGIAGVIKVMLAMKHRKLPALQNFQKLNARISTENTPFFMLEKNRDWLPREETRNGVTTNLPLRAGVSSFGFGGTNAHIVLEEAPRARVFADASLPVHVICLSAKTREALQKIEINLLAWLRRCQDLPRLIDLSATLSLGREHFNVRSVYIVKNIQALIEALGRSCEGSGDNYHQIDVNDDARKLIATEAGNALLLKAKTGKKLDEKVFVKNATAIAEAYLAGADLNWALFLGRVKHQRLNLPTYPFARDEFWISKETGTVERHAAVHILHPLLHQNISDLENQRYSSVFSGQEFFLKDHKVNNIPVLPGVVYLEMASEAIKRAVGIQPGADKTVYVALKNVIWLRPFILAEGGARRLDISIYPAAESGIGDDTRYSYPVRFEIASGFEAQATLINCQGEGRIESLVQAPQLDVQEIGVGDGAASISAEACYEYFAQMDLNFGPAHRVIETITSSENQLLAKVSVVDGLSSKADGYTLHPAMFDGAMQAAVALLGEFHHQTDGEKRELLLPFSVEAINVFRACNESMWTWVRYSPGANSHRDAKKIDIDLFSSLPEAGKPAEVSVQVRGLSLRPVKLKSIVDQKAADEKPLSLLSSKQSYYTPHWFEAPFSDSAGLAPMQALLIVGAKDEVSKLLTRLQGAPNFSSTQFITAYFGEEYRQESAAVFSVRAGSEEDMQRLVADLRTEKRLPEHVLILASGLTELGGERGDETGSDALKKGAESIFVLVKAYMKGAKAARFISLTQGNREAFVPVHQGLSGFYKTVKIEKPSFDGRVVQCNWVEMDGSFLSSIILGELRDKDVETDVVYGQNQRFVRGFVAVEEKIKAELITVEQQVSGFRNNGVYLITGGLGALGVIIAKHLSSQYQATVYLTGRSAVSPEKQALLSEINALGGKAHFIACDVCNQADVEEAISTINQNGHRINGLIHSAGVIEDNFILRKSAESFGRVIAPKTLGTSYLDHATKDQPLDCFILFSSVTGALGNLGQCDYGFGNCYADYFSFHRNALVKAGHRTGKTVSINWPYWKNGGMVLTDKEEAILNRNFGITPLENANGLEAMEFAVTAPLSQLAVLEGDASKIHQVLGVRSLSLTGAVIDDPIAIEAPVHRKDQSTAETLKEKVVDYLKSLFAKELKLSEDRFELNASFQNYGFDSVVMIDLVNVLEKQFAGLPKTLFFEYQTLGELAAFFAEQYADQFTTESSAQPTASAALSRRPMIDM